MSSVRNSHVFTSPINLAQPATVVAGTGTGTPGSISVSYPMEGNLGSIYAIIANALNNTASYTFLNTYTQQPATLASPGLTVSAISTTAITITTTGATSGTVIVAGT